MKNTENEELNSSKKKEIKGKNILTIVLRVAVILVVLTASLFLLSGSPIFSITEISVTGVQYYNEKQITEISGLKIGQNGFATLWGEEILSILTLRCGEAERNIIESCPYVKKAYVRYLPPGKILIDIEERSKSVVIPYQDFGLLVDEEGFVIDIIKNYQKSELPIVRGVSFDQYALGRRLAVDNELYLEMVILLISALRQSDRDSEDRLSYVVEFIDVSDLNNIKLFIEDRFVVYLGDGSDIYYRISALKEIYFTGLTSGERGIIDFSSGAKPVFRPEPIIT